MVLPLVLRAARINNTIKGEALTAGVFLRPLARELLLE